MNFRLAIALMWCVSGLLLMEPTCTFAQHEYDKWYFGNRGLNFAANPPTVIINSSMSTLEGSASYCNPTTGQLICYTDGATVWARDNTVLAGGLNGHPSSTQAALIVPHPGDSTKLYIFTTESGDVSTKRGLCYSIVDLDWKVGDPPIVLNKRLLSNTTEKAVAISICEGSAYWVIGHEYGSNRFFSWRLDQNGLDTTPVISRVGPVHGVDSSYTSVGGYLVASPNGSLLASAIAGQGVFLHNFDPFTGSVTSTITVAASNQPYGLCFSPDNSKLYSSSPLVGRIAQYDLAALDSASIASSKALLGTNKTYAMQLGPDGKIYTQDVGSIGVIQNPNLSGLAASYVANYVTMPGATICYGLPNNIVGYASSGCRIPEISLGISRFLCCANDTVSVSAQVKYFADSVSWLLTGAESYTEAGLRVVNIKYSKPGLYNIRAIAHSKNGADTAYTSVTVEDCSVPQVTLTDTIVCVGDCITFSDTSIATNRKWTIEGGPGGATTGRTATICYTKVGKYKITLIASNAYGADTASCTVDVIDCSDLVGRFIHDTLICVNSEVEFIDKSVNASSWEWSFEGGTPTTASTKDPGKILYQATGRYRARLIVTNSSDRDTFYSYVNVIECNAPEAQLESSTICEGDCLVFMDSCKNSPTSWDWTFEGATLQHSTNRDPGSICFNLPGEYPVKLIVSNEFGSDTATALVHVLNSRGSISAGSVEVLKTLTACSRVDTSIWLFAGCKPLTYACSSASKDVLIVPAGGVLQPLDSVLVTVTIKPKTPGDITSLADLTLNDTVLELPISYKVLSDKRIAADVSTINFGETNICEERDSLVTLTNKGCDTLTITAADIDKNFAVGDGKLPIVLAPGESIGLPITTIVDTTGKPRTLTGTLSITSTADNQIAPITLTRELYYPTKLRIEVVDDASGRAGDVVKFRVLLEGQVPATMTALHFDFLHNADLLSWDGYDGVGLNRTNVSGNENERASFTLSPVHDGVIGEFSFKTNLALAEQTTLSFDNITFEAAGVSFAPECIAVISDTGTRFNYIYTCGDNIIRDRLNGTRLIKSITPNPASGEIRLELSVPKADITLINALGAEVLKTSSDRIDVSSLPSGTYYVRVSTTQDVQTKRVVISR